MKSIIKKAIEGGWMQKYLKENTFDYCGYGKNIYLECIDLDTGLEKDRICVQEIICDPLFWQSLGKACGWENEIEEVVWLDKGAYRDSSIVDGFYNDLWKLETWKFHAMQFHRINLTEGWDKAVAYLEDLIK